MKCKNRKSQNKKLRQIVRYAYNNCKFYHDKWKEEKILPKDIKTVDDLRKLPIITKEDLQKNLLDIIPKNRNLIELRTSGSTGVPLSIKLSKKELYYRAFQRLRILRKYGLKLTDKQFIITEPRHTKELLSLTNIYRNIGFLRKQKASIYEDQKFIINKINKFQPDYIHGFASSIKLLSQKIIDQNKKFNLRFITTTAEIVDKKTKKTIEKAFNCTHYDIYNCVELGDIAWECPNCNKYHINESQIIVELLDESNNVVKRNDEGIITCTSLINKTTPLIRYKLGDKSIVGTSNCNKQALTHIFGREIDYITLKNKVKISPYTITNKLGSIIGLKKYLVFQESLNKITIKIEEKNKLKFNTIVKEAKKQLKKITEEKIKINFKQVKNIPLEKSGKLGVVKSNIK